MALLQHYSVFYGIINKTPLYEAFTVTFVENPVLTLWKPMKINALRNLTHKFNVQSMILRCLK